MTAGAGDVVTGAHGFTGRHIAARLVAAGRQVTALTNRPAADSPFGAAVPARPLRFDDAAALVEVLRGVHTLYNTYWVRFPHGSVTFESAVENSRRLWTAARQAGVRRIVHVSITNPAADSPLPYFRGKARIETALRESGLSWAVIRPTVIFGPGDILINNIAWLLRHWPIFGLFGDGQYRIQPVFVEDLADLAVCLGAAGENVVVDAVGPDVFAFGDMVRMIRDTIGAHARIVSVSPRVALWIARIAGWFLGDVLITREEIAGLMAGLLVSADPPTCRTRLGAWLAADSDRIGRRYASELRRHYLR